MLNRSEIKTMLILRNRENNVFSQLPAELSQISEYDQDPDSDFGKAIKHVARGELSEVETILNEVSKKRRNLFLMPHKDPIKISDNDNLYLYKNDEGIPYYKLQDDDEIHYLTAEMIIKILKDEKFNQSDENLVKCEEKAICDIVYEEISKKGHAYAELRTLLFSVGTAVTRCGLIVKKKTLLECAIGEGDLEMVELIKSYFPKFAGGEKEMERQFEQYRPCIEAMKDQKADDLKWLFDIIKKSSLKDVLAELAEGDQYDANYQSELRTAFNQFRKQKLDPKVRVVTKPRMHCNYQNLIHAYDMLDSNWDELIEKNATTQEYCYDKRRLVARQIIGLIQLLELSSYERYLFARAQVDSMAKGQQTKAERSVNYIYDSGSFPDFNAALIKSHSGFGFGFYSSIFGGGAGAWPTRRLVVDAFTKLISNKNNRLAEFILPHPKPKTGSGMIV